MKSTVRKWCMGTYVDGFSLSPTALSAQRVQRWPVCTGCRLVLFNFAFLAAGSDTGGFLLLRRPSAVTCITMGGRLTGILNLGPLGVPAISPVVVILVGSRAAGGAGSLVTIRKLVNIAVHSPSIHPLSVFIAAAPFPIVVVKFVKAGSSVIVAVAAPMITIVLPVSFSVPVSVPLALALAVPVAVTVTIATIPIPIAVIPTIAVAVPVTARIIMGVCGFPLR